MPTLHSYRPPRVFQRRDGNNKLQSAPPLAVADDHESFIQQDRKFVAALAHALRTGGESAKATLATVRVKDGRRRTFS